MSDLNTRSSTLIVKSSKGITKEIEMTTPTFTIGRKSGNDLALDDPSVSGHHAKIVKIQEVWFLEDLTSTNGTFVNEHKIERKQLRDADVIRIGTYRIIYRHDDVALSGIPSAPPSTHQADHTIVCATSMSSAQSTAPSLIGSVEVVSGKTDQPQYTLTKQLSVIGTQDDAAIKLTGWFAPKSAATIGRLGQGYVLSMVDGGKVVRVNGISVKGQASLSDGDMIEVAGVKMHFHLREAKRR
ncbi:MAG: FHA domain-containing protein [Nitrospiraceae bacterium]